MVRLFFDVTSESGDLSERLVFSIYQNVNSQVSDFLLKLIRERSPGTFSYRGSLIYTFTSAFFTFGNISRQGVAPKIPASDPQYPYKVAKLGAGRAIPRAGYLCLIPADATSSSQELLVTLKDCSNYHKDLVCVGELDGDVQVLERIATYADAQMLRPKRLLYISNCGVEGESEGPKSGLVDVIIQGERDRKAAAREREAQWEREFAEKMGKPAVDMAKVRI